MWILYGWMLRIRPKKGLIPYFLFFFFGIHTRSLNPCKFLTETPNYELVSFKQLRFVCFQVLEVECGSTIEPKKIQKLVEGYILVYHHRNKKGNSNDTTHSKV